MDQQSSFILNNVSGYLLFCENNGLITHISQSLSRDLEMDQAQIVGHKKVEDLLTAGSRIFFQTHFYPLVKLHGVYNELFLTFLSSSSQEIPVLLNAQIAKEDKQVITCFGIRITKRNHFEQEILAAKKSAEKALQENEELLRARSQLETNRELMEQKMRQLTLALREQQEITNILSHDLQEPLRKVSMFSKLLQRDIEVMGKESWITYLSKVMGSTEQMRNLIQNIQFYLTLNEKKIKLSEFSLRACLASSLQLTVGEDPNIKVELPDDCLVNGDAELIQELFCELFSNSIRFSDPLKPFLKITVSVDVTDENRFREMSEEYRYDQYLRIRVIDNGLGFQNAMATDVFHLFRKAHSFKEGLGVGLAYCRKIVELHQGNILISSQLSEGTTVTVFLPLTRT